MSAITLHAMDDDLASALRQRAAELGTSLNQAAKTLLASALGLGSAVKRERSGFLRFAGSISPKDAGKLRAFVDGADFSKVSEGDWK